MQCKKLSKYIHVWSLSEKAKQKITSLAKSSIQEGGRSHCNLGTNSPKFVSQRMIICHQKQVNILYFLNSIVSIVANVEMVQKKLFEMVNVSQAQDFQKRKRPLIGELQYYIFLRYQTTYGSWQPALQKPLISSSTGQAGNTWTSKHKLFDGFPSLYFLSQNLTDISVLLWLDISPRKGNADEDEEV